MTARPDDGESGGARPADDRIPGDRIPGDRTACPASTPGGVHRSVEVVNSAGLHARPCHAIVSKALQFPGAVLEVASGERTVNGKSILELMTLEAAKGAKVELRGSGTDARAMVDGVAELFDTGFGE